MHLRKFIKECPFFPILFPKSVITIVKPLFPSLRAFTAGHPWLTPVILATQEAEMRRITVRSQPGEIVCETLFRKTLSKKIGLVD
jgi:hypothetical protein